MSGRPFKYRMMKGLEDERGLQYYGVLSKTYQDRAPDATAMITGTGPEKQVFNYLDRLGVRFTFQYSMNDVASTDYPEDLYVPDFFLQDYNIQINVFGNYWHSMASRRMKDLIQSARNLYAGRVVIENGIPLYPSGGTANGKYIIWWETEVYQDIGFLFARDVPELLAVDTIKGENEHFLFDWKEEAKTARNKSEALAMAKLVPSFVAFRKQERALKAKEKDLKKIYPFL